MGAELRSIQAGADNHEIIWQRDPAIWEGSAPILFPIVGGLRDGRCSIRGRDYAIPKHGLVRRRLWEVTRQSATQVTFACSSDAESRQQYPWEWHLEATFSIEAATLRVDYQLTNTGVEELWTSLGSHPAFNLDFGAGDLEDYLLKIDTVKPMPERFKLMGDALSANSFPVQWKGNELPLHASLFDEDALIFKDAGVSAVTLASRSSSRTLTVTTGGAPDLGIWAKPGAAFVCIEPWYGYNDPEDHDGDFLRKPGLFCVPLGGAFRSCYCIDLNDAWF